ncbi:MAG: hypothetical protein ACYS22_13015, partial [Planctomycetota bacterium]
IESGVRLFDQLEARALILAGASRFANRDGTADVSNPRNLQTFFQLAHQVITRESDPNDLLCLSVRGFLTHTEPIDAFLSTRHETKSQADLPPRLFQVADLLTRLRARTAFFDGSPQRLRFQGRRTAQWSYSQAHAPRTFATVWLSSALRNKLRGVLTGADLDPARPAELGLPMVRRNLLFHVNQLLTTRRAAEATLKAPGEPTRAALDAADARVIEQLRRFGQTSNVAHLLGAEADARAVGGRLVHLIDPAARRQYVIYEAPRSSGTLLYAVSPDAPTVLPSEGQAAARLDRTLRVDDADLVPSLRHFIQLGHERLLIVWPRASDPGGGR